MNAVDYLYHVAQKYDCQCVEEETETVKQSATVHEHIEQFWCDFWKKIAEYYGKEKDE